MNWDKLNLSFLETTNDMDYILIHSWARSWDQWGLEYKCDKSSLEKVVRENDSNHPFIVILKDYLGLK